MNIIRLLSPEPVVVTQPQSTRAEDPTLLCNQVAHSTRLFYRFRRFPGLDRLLEAAGHNRMCYLIFGQPSQEYCQAACTT
jgi:hypothetical protein